MSEFLNLEPVAPLASDQLLLVRDRQKKRVSVADLISTTNSSGAIAYSPTPPANKSLWWQTDDGGNPTELWKRNGELWLSDRVHVASAYRGSLSVSLNLYPDMPLLGASYWIEDMRAQGTSRIDESGVLFDFVMSLVNSASLQTPVFYLRLQNSAADAAFYMSEPVQKAVAIDEAVMLCLSAQRNSSKAKLDHLTLAVGLRKIYAPNS